jgi:hypothetical protein
MTERTAVRLGIPTLLLASTAGAVGVSVNTAPSDIPNFAFGSPVVLSVQLSLLFFYAALLLLVPLARALTDGALPVELSLKGARWSESINGLVERQGENEEEALLEIFELHQEIAALKRILREATGYRGSHGRD